MKRWIKPWPMTILIIASLLLLFSFWYRGNDPLSDADIAQFLAYIETLEAPKQAFINQNDVRTFLSDDDGKAFYVVNLFKFKEADGLDNFEQFTQAILPLWLRHGVHPVFSSTAILNENSQWDRIAIVKYRSRRDWVNIVSDDIFTEALALRFAATDTNLRLVVTGVSIPNPILLFGLLGGVILSTLFLVGKIVARKQ